VFYVLIAEILERFGDMSAENASKAFVVYKNFVTLTNIMKTKADKIMMEFEFTMKTPEYLTPDSSLVETLRQCVEQK
jgi:hypothetical protein